MKGEVPEDLKTEPALKIGVDASNKIGWIKTEEKESVSNK